MAFGRVIIWWTAGSRAESTSTGTVPTKAVGSPAPGGLICVTLVLTPIFLLSGVAALLNLFATRLGRIADQVDKRASEPAKHPRQLTRLRLGLPLARPCGVARSDRGRPDVWCRAHPC